MNKVVNSVVLSNYRVDHMISSSSHGIVHGMMMTKMLNGHALAYALGSGSLVPITH